MYALSMLFILAACTPSDKEDTASDTDVTTNSTETEDTTLSTTTAERLLLLDGTYGNDDGFVLENNTCGNLADSMGFYTVPVILSWEGEDVFSIQFQGGPSVTCDVADDSASCSTYQYLFEPGNGSVITMDSLVTIPTVHSATHFTLVESLSWTCSEGDCTGWADSLETYLPCDMDVVADYSL